MGEDGHGEPAIEKLLAESRCDRESKIRKQFYSGLRKNPFRNGLKRAPRFSGNPPHAPEVQPLKGGNRRSADNGSDKDAGSFFFQAEDGIRDLIVTGVQTCALPI